MEILPHRTADGARDADEVLEARPSAPHGLEDEIAHDRAALGGHVSLGGPVDARADVPDHDPAEATVADEDVRAEAEHEVRRARLARGEHGAREILRGVRFVETRGIQARREILHFFRSFGGGPSFEMVRVATAGVARRASTRCTSESEPPA